MLFLLQGLIRQKYVWVLQFPPQKPSATAYTLEVPNKECSKSRQEIQTSTYSFWHAVPCARAGSRTHQEVRAQENNLFQRTAFFHYLWISWRPILGLGKHSKNQDALNTEVAMITWMHCKAKKYKPALDRETVALKTPVCGGSARITGVRGAGKVSQISGMTCLLTLAGGALEKGGPGTYNHQRGLSSTAYSDPFMNVHRQLRYARRGSWPSNHLGGLTIKSIYLRSIFTKGSKVCF